MSAAARRSRPANPQSGPSRASSGNAGFFHFALKWILADPGRIAGLHVSNYINRIEQGGLDRFAAERVDANIGLDPAGLRASAYITREDGDEHGELGAHVLIARGLPVTTGAQLARLLDARERKVDRTYRCYGGSLPRVASHLVASFRYGVTAKQAGQILADFAQCLSDRLQVPIEGQVHIKGGRADHIHLLIGTRVVMGGRLGKKCRSLDAVSEKADGRAVDVGGRLVGETAEWMRSEWAARMRAATGDMAVDHRSYARRGVAITPVTQVPRADIEYERRRGTTAWRDRRRRELAMRVRVPSAVQPIVAGELQDQKLPTQHQAIEPSEVEQRAELLLSVLTESTFVKERGATNRSAADELADLLGLAVPGGTLSELLRQRKRTKVRRRAEILLGALTQSAAFRENGAAGRKTADDLADLLGLQVPGEAIQELLRRRERTDLRQEAEVLGAFRKPTGGGTVFEGRAGELTGLVGRPRSVASVRDFLSGSRQAQSQGEHAVRPIDPDANPGREPPRRGKAKAPVQKGDKEPLHSSPADAGTSDRALDPPAAILPATTPNIPAMIDKIPALPLIPETRSANGVALPIMSHRIVEEGDAAGRLDGRLDATRAAHSGGAGLDKPSKKDNADVSGRRKPQPPASTAPLENSPTRSAIEQGFEIEQPRDEPHAGLQDAIAVFHALRNRRRLTSPRVQTLAASVGMARSTFEAAAIAHAAPEPAQDHAIDRLPPHLSQLWQQWAQADNEARRLRRIQAELQQDRVLLAGPATDNLVDTPQSHEMPSGYGVSRSTFKTGAARGTSPGQTKAGGDRDPNDRCGELASKPAIVRQETTLPQAGAEQPGAGIKPEAAPSPDVIDRALVGAFIRDVQTEAKRKGKVLSATALERGIAVRLRVTGRSRTEIEAVLLSVSDPAKAGLAQERIVEATAHAFSDRTTKRLRMRTGFVSHIEAIERQTEARLFRSLRRQALDKLGRDLDVVWIERRMRAEEAARRHARRLGLLHNLRWRTSRARRRSTIVLAVLSALVEVAVLRPLIARQQALGAAERRAIDDAAERASSELKRLRQEWRERVIGARTSSPGSKASSEGPAVDPSSVAVADWGSSLSKVRRTSDSLTSPGPQSAGRS